MPSALPKQQYPEVTRIFKIQKEVSGEIKNYRKIAKKYNKAQTATHYVAVGLGCLWAAPSASGIALTLTGPGIIVGAPWNHCWQSLLAQRALFAGLGLRGLQT